MNNKISNSMHTEKGSSASERNQSSKVLDTVAKYKHAILPVLLTVGAVSIAKGQMSHMAPDHPCIATQIQMYGNIAP